MKNKIPKRRFIEFTSSWEVRKVMEIFPTVSSGNRLPKQNITLGDIPYVIAQITNNGIYEYVDYKIKDYHGNDMKLFEAPAISFSIDNPKAVFIQTKPFFTSNIMRVLSNDNLRIEHYSFFIESIKSLTTYFDWSIKFSGPVVMNSNILVPVSDNKINFDEIFKVGNFFKKLDSMIEIQSQKINKYEMLKVSYLEKMLPKTNKLVPEYRFKGFTDDWVQHKLEEHAEITMGQSPSSINYTDDPSDYILVQGNADMKGGLVVARVWTTEVTKKGEVGDIIFSVRAPVGDIGKTDYSVVLGRGVASIRGNDFIYYDLTKKKMDNYWDRISTGSTFDSINSFELRNSPIISPTLEEQLKLGFLFEKIDTIITLHRHKLNKLKNLKKAYLNEMFVN